MNKIIKDQQIDIAPTAQIGRSAKIGRSPFLMKTISAPICDVGMESVGSRTGQHGGHDPEDLMLKKN